MIIALTITHHVSLLSVAFNVFLCVIIGLFKYVIHVAFPVSLPSPLSLRITTHHHVILSSYAEVSALHLFKFVTVIIISLKIVVLLSMPSAHIFCS